MAEAQTKIKWNEESVIGGTFVQAVVVGLMSSETKQVQKLEHWEMRINANKDFKNNTKINGYVYTPSSEGLRWA